MSTLEAKKDVFALLSPIAPCYLRGSVKADNPPADPKHFIVDGVGLAVGYGLGCALYDLPSIQVGAWALTGLAAEELADEARALLEPLLFQVQNQAELFDGDWHGIARTYRKLY